MNVENNKLIAEFMGNGKEYHINLKNKTLVSYHNSWDELMPVVDKIETTERDSQKLLLELIGKRAKFIGEFGCRYFEDSIGETKIESAYKAVVEFIKWYNEQKNIIEERLEYLRKELRAECISTGELIELQSLAKHIEPGDVELLEAAGVPEGG